MVNNTYVQVIKFSTHSGQYAIAKKMIVEDGKMSILMLSSTGEWIDVLEAKSSINLDHFKLSLCEVDFG